MKKNILIGLGVLLAVVVIALVGCGLYLYHIYNPKGCVSLQNSNYPPAFAITENSSYPSDSTEISKIVNVKNSCLAVIKGEDSSIDKCSAINNLNETINLLAVNAKNSGNKTEQQAIVEELASVQKTIADAEISSCKEENELLNKAFNSITKAFTSKSAK